MVRGMGLEPMTTGVQDRYAATALPSENLVRIVGLEPTQQDPQPCVLPLTLYSVGIQDRDRTYT